MDVILQKVADFIRAENKSLTEELLNQTIDHLNLDLTDEQVEKHKGLLEVLLDNVATGLLSTERETKDLELEYDIDNFFYYDGALLKDTIEIISTFRLSLLYELQHRGLVETNDAQDLSQLYHLIIYIFDDAIRNTTKKFNLENVKVIERIEQEILELAAPIVSIKKGIAVLPLIGSFSELRASNISTRVIPKVVDMNINMLIIDFSGIENFDAYTAKKIFQIREVLQVLGIQPIITGLRPSIAQTAVSVGIDTKNLQTYATVQQFLKEQEYQQEIH